jgi:hypothetical protein
LGKPLSLSLTLLIGFWRERRLKYIPTICPFWPARLSQNPEEGRCGLQDTALKLTVDVTNGVHGQGQVWKNKRPRMREPTTICEHDNISGSSNIVGNVGSTV